MDELGREQDRAVRKAALARDLGRMANLLTGLDYRCHMAAVRLDYEELERVSDQILRLHTEYASAYRRFKVLMLPAQTMASTVLSERTST